MTNPISTDLENAFVEEPWEEDKGWKWELFAHLLPNNILRIISSFELMHGEEWEDHLVWDGASSREFSIKSALTLIREDIPEVRDQIWQFIWKLKAPQRIRFFLWLVAHGRLMTNTNRVSRGLADDLRCKGCLLKEEDTIHLLRDCKCARDRGLVPADAS